MKFQFFRILNKTCSFWLQISSCGLGGILWFLTFKTLMANDVEHIFVHLLAIFLNIYLFLERGEGRKKEWERNIDVRNINLLPLVHAPTRDQTCNPGTCPDGKSNWWPFTLWNNAQPTEPHCSGLLVGHLYIFFGKTSFQILCSLFNWAICLYYLV